MSAQAATCDVAAAPHAPRIITVPMGQSAIADGTARLRTVGLGSCLAVVIFAPRHETAALAHCMLPDGGDETEPLAKYVATAIPHLLEVLREAGADAPFSATLIGGASMFPGLADGFVRDIAGRNVETARKVLTDSAVKIRAEDVGGHVGRSVLIDPSTQRVIVHTIRGGDRCL